MSIPKNVRVSNSLRVNSKGTVIGIRIQFPPDHSAEQISSLLEYIQDEIKWFFTVEDKL